MLLNVSKDSDWVILGRFGRPHGVKGMITVISFAEPRDNLLLYKTWYRCIGNSWEPLSLLQVEAGHKHILARVEGYQEREQVASLTNVEIAVRRDELPVLAPGEFYWHQLLGMKVTDQQGVPYGLVTEIMPTGANDVLVVTGEKRYLIPYLPGVYVLKVDDNQRVITVDWDRDF